MQYLKKMILEREKNPGVGIYSCCSANSWVLEAAMLRAKRNNTPVLIEATANQVNQFGGYTGMKPADFYSYVEQCACKTGLPMEQVILGGDHLGPLTWADLPTDAAMANSEELVREYVLAGFEKIHLDTSIRLAEDTDGLDDQTIAQRGAQLCRVAEQAYQERKKTVPDAAAPVYIIGSEVPIPGGMQQTHSISVTSKEACLNTLETYYRVFAQYGLEDALKRVIGLVVQPGVEFGNEEVCEYQSNAAQELVSVLKDYPQIVFEGHSTDYQTRRALSEMVSDGIAILKVGPALTFMLREALFALEHIERELLLGSGRTLSEFRATAEFAMLQNDSNWKKHCTGDGNRQKLERAFGLSDRVRYYLPVPEVREAEKRLIYNLSGVRIPYYLLSQYLPVQYAKVREGLLANDVTELILDHIGCLCDDYLAATGQLQ